MENKRIVQLIQNPDLIELSDKDYIDRKLEKYPFVQSFHFLKLKWKQSFAKHEIKETIETLSLYSNYRELIKETLEKSIHTKPILVDVVTQKTEDIQPAEEEVIEETKFNNSREIFTKKQDNTEIIEGKEIGEVSIEEEPTLSIKSSAVEDTTLSRIEDLDKREEDKIVSIANIIATSELGADQDRILEEKESSNIDKLGLSYLFSKEKNDEKQETLLYVEEDIVIKSNEEVLLTELEKEEILEETEAKEEEIDIPEGDKLNDLLHIEEEIELGENDNIDVAEKEEVLLVNEGIQEVTIGEGLDYIEKDTAGLEQSLYNEEETTDDREEDILEIIDDEIANLKENILEKLTFSQWLSLPKEQASKEKIGIKEKQQDIINKFIETNPKIEIPVKKEMSSIGIDFKKEEIKEIANLMTETLAQLYIEQGKYDTAIVAYKILSLKFPEKSSFFAKEIKKIRKLKNTK